MKRANAGAQGVTLIELLIGLVIAVAVIFAATHASMTRARMTQGQRTLEHMQVQAHTAMMHVQKRFHEAYYVWYPDATPLVQEIYVQRIDPSVVGVGVPLTADQLKDPSTFVYEGYQWDSAARELLFEEHVCPGGQPTLPGYRQGVLASEIDVFDITPFAARPPAAGQRANMFNLSMIAGDQTTSQFHQINIVLANRQTAETLPAGWRPRCDPACHGNGVCPP